MHSQSEPGAPRDVSGATTPVDAEPDPADLPPPQAISEAARRFAELREYLAYFLSLRIDRLRVTVRRTVILAVLGIVALIVGAAVVATGSVLLCIGLAEALSAAMGGRAWAGNLLVGAVVLLSLGIGCWIGLARLRACFRRRTVQKYELRQKRQRSEFGHDVGEQAHTNGQSQ